MEFINHSIFNVSSAFGRVAAKVAYTLRGDGVNTRTYGGRYFKTKVDEQVALFESRDGQSFIDSPRQILLEMLNRDDSPTKDFYIVFDPNFQREVRLGMRLVGIEDHPQVHLVERNSYAYVEKLLTAKYLVTNSTFQDFFVPKDEQVYINTWHGTPLKHMGYAMPNGRYMSRNVMRNFMMSDYLLSPNAHTSEIFKRDYRLQGLYDGQLVEDGYPRNDVVFQSPKKSVIDFLKSTTEFDVNKKTILYAPTWSSETTGLDKMDSDIDRYLTDFLELRKTFGDDYNILLKVHPFIYGNIHDDPAFAPVLVNDGIDPNDLMPLTDILLTDYSSIFFDFLLTKKPIIFYDTTINYAETRGYYMDLDTLPGPHLTKINQVKRYIKNIESEKKAFRSKYRRFVKSYVVNDDGHATKRLVNHLWQNKPIKTVSIDTTSKKNVVIYTGGLANNGITVALRNLLNEIDYERYDVSLLTLMDPANKTYWNNLESLNPELRVFSVFGDSVMAIRDALRKNFVQKHGTWPFAQSRYPKRKAQLNSKRLLAKSHFDVAIDFDSYHMANGQWIAMADADRKVNIVHNDIKRVNGISSHQISENYVAFWRHYDQTLSVSEATRTLNRQRVGKYLSDDGILMNQINYQEVIDFAKQNNTTYYPVNIQARLFETGDLVADQQKLHQATYVEPDREILAKTVLPVTKAKVSEKEMVFISNSRLSPEKNIESLIKAFIKLHVKYPQAVLHIFGSGEESYEATLYRLVLTHHAEDYIIFYGFQNNPYPALKAADVFVLTSYTEAQSMALMEALILKTDILTSNITANAEVVENGALGLMTDGVDEEAIYRGLEIYVQHRYRPLKRFDPRQHNQQAMKQFDQLFES